MTRAHRIAVLGFSAFERKTLASYFRLAATREPRYDLVQMLTDADYVVADSDHGPSVQLVVATERMAETVFIGAHPPTGAMAWVARPIDPLHVMRELDSMVVMAQRRMHHPTSAPGVVTVIQPQRRQPTLPPQPLPQAQPSQPQPLSPLPPDHEGLLERAVFHSTGGGALHPLPDAPAPTPTPTSTPGLTLTFTSAEAIAPSAPAAPASPMPAPTGPPAPAVAALPTPVSEQAAARVPSTTPAPAPAPEPVPGSMPIIAVEPRAARASAATAARPAAPPAPLPQLAPTALLVDDSEIALRYLETRLTPWGLKIDRASGSGKAIELLAQHDYDFVFLDLELGPGSDLDGLALCQHIKRHHAGSTSAALSTAVIIVSAHHSELDRVRGALAGCDAYLGKPMQEIELRRLLLRHGLKPPPVPAADARELS